MWHRPINPYRKTLTAQTEGNSPPVVARVFRSILYTYIKILYKYITYLLCIYNMRI